MIKHENTTQKLPAPYLNPLLATESPYYNNLNRAPKNVYDYVNSVNNVLSYGGYVSRVLPQNAQANFQLYNIVQIVDGEIIIPLSASPDINGRYGIIVSTQDDSGYYIVCTFCPNFVYPTQLFTSGQINYNLNASSITPVYNLLATTSSGITLGKITGLSSMFFSGTVRLFS